MDSPRKASASSAPPPPIPRRNPSRPSLRASISGASVDSHNSPLSSSLTSPPADRSPLHLDHPPISRGNSAFLLGGSGAGAGAATRTSAGTESPSPNLNPSPNLRLATGFASVRVGIGSPILDFRSSKGRREGSGGSASPSTVSLTDDQRDPSTSRRSSRSSRHVTPTESKVINGVIDRVSGLPSPPGTESDIGPPSSSPSKLPNVIAPLRTSGRSSANLSPHRTPSLTSSSSTPRRLRPKASPSLSRSSSSSSALLASPAHSTPNHQRATSNGNGNGGWPRSISPVKPPAHTRSPSAPSPQMERRSSKRMSGSWENGFVEDPRREERSPRIGSAGASLDDRIREAEEKIKHATARRSRPSTAETKSPESPRGELRRHDSYRSAQSHVVASTSTLRRSATLSSTTRSNGEEADTPDRRDRTLRMHNGTPARDSEQERSGGSSGSGKRKPLPSEFRQSSLFTPASKGVREECVNVTLSPRQPSRPSTVNRPVDSPTSAVDPSPLQSRFRTASRLSRDLDSVTSPSASRSNRNPLRIEGVERASSVALRGDPSPYARRQWSESVSGLPKMRDRDDLDHRGLPLPRQRLQSDRQRAESVLDTAVDRQRYYQAEPAPRAASRLNILPTDSVSAVGARSERSDPAASSKKDPLDVIRRMEESRAQHNRQWQEDRAASVLGDVRRSPTRSYSRTEFTTPLHPRSATSMSNLRGDRAPQTAPVDRFHRRWDDLPASPSVRSFSRAAAVGPASEPRAMRSSTSLGMRSNTSLSLDIASASTEHGRLLFEAFRALELKLPAEVVSALPDLMRSFHSSTREAEALNTSLRTALQLTTDISVKAELGNSTQHHDLDRLTMTLRDAARTSDQSIRDLTRIMLDLPRLVREKNRIPASSSTGSLRAWRTESVVGATNDAVNRSPEVARRWVPSANDEPTYGSPLPDRPARHSVDVLRPATSLADIRRDRPGSTSSFLSKVRGLTPRKHEDLLQTIEASPPSVPTSRVPSNAIPEPPLSPSRRRHAPDPLPISPVRPTRNVLRKKPSTASTNTVKGSPFLPTSPRVRTTTAVSTITAGDGADVSPPSRSIRSWRSSVEAPEPSSPMSRYSANYISAEVSKRSSRVNDDFEYEPEEQDGAVAKATSRFSSVDSFDAGGLADGNDVDAVAMLEQRLALAAREREEGELSRRKSLTQRVKASLRSKA